jgi:hypothetical protein
MKHAKSLGGPQGERYGATPDASKIYVRRGAPHGGSRLPFARTKPGEAPAALHHGATAC